MGASVSIDDGLQFLTLNECKNLIGEELWKPCFDEDFNELVDLVHKSFLNFTIFYQSNFHSKFYFI